MMVQITAIPRLDPAEWERRLAAWRERDAASTALLAEAKREEREAKAARAREAQRAAREAKRAGVDRRARLVVGLRRDGLTLRAIAQVVGVGPERIRQILRRVEREEGRRLEDWEASECRESSALAWNIERIAGAPLCMKAIRELRAPSPPLDTRRQRWVK